MVDLRKKPYQLNNKQVEWVNKTLEKMSLEEKIGQLFITLKTEPGVNEAKIKDTLDKYHQGGLRWQGGEKKDVYLQNSTYQKVSEIPLLIAANCDEGGTGCLPKEGTFVATAAQAAANESEETAYHMGLVASREATSIGCNWLFNPVVDIYMNWRNTIVNTRCFGDNPETVIRNTKAFIKGAKEGNPNMACCIKHFPGDGVEELDQHLVMGINDLSVDEWKNTYGKVYNELINEGIESIMVGHIALPEMSRKLRPDIKDEEIMPATLAPELLTDLLRGEMGYNGLVLTDATHMIGFSGMKKREEAVPLAIAAGCDMILFANDIEEDIAFVKKSIENNIVTIERLNEAVTRILGLKAKLELTNPAVAIPNPELIYTSVNTEEHQSFRKLAADRCTTLVKDTANLIPVNPLEKKKIWLVYVQSVPTSIEYIPDPSRQIMIDELEQAGFEVTLAPCFYDLELENGPTPLNMVKMLGKEPRKAFKEKYDLVLVAMNIKGYAQENNVRIKWSQHHSIEFPWYIPEVPTIGISLNYTNHLIDIPQIKTFINGFGSTRDNIRAVIEKMCGKSEFTGEVKEHYFCERWEAKL
ncbi:beta-N-acetylhexosaminidase [Natranaerovirga hydrolytica]|uniref:beta-N-acetylhexosaminidase n=1 Tax=Natranaerovirga hydrolytica TaxID=680378 RepID=A0A4R1MJ93_9FIRM|nr:glycoside hydrolase family 3 N-terminal domain-containing protein [Natranaerovirga hydrolytica]TCK92495.1 beta-N-acetylhexosaminidase [Natranaerovirga hydrolytica]